ncbi:hypothetical protein [Aeromicrobium ginsengisoli]|uniref:Uncharacterized protein n=1 Tax=Aeromicrobium ginsengisoli TaxID=363867 RepID=A0A5M4FHX7_9ACTN|nr:hypothetical protein [Aeromicrobium ginsengisoli]KAA1399651.1 hypothetical protein ESP70_002500 [Aeromicrobium ginsengisoli]
MAAVKNDADGKADVCSNVDASTFDLSEDLAAAYTQKEVAAAACEAIRFQYDAGWTDLAIPGHTVRVSGGQAITETLRPWLTERALNNASTLAVKSADGDGAADDDLIGLTMVNLTNPDWNLRAQDKEGSLIVDDRSWGDADLTIDKTADAAGRERVDVTIKFTDQMLLTRKSDGVLGSVPVTRTITYAMSQTSLKDHPWLVDGWSAKWTYGTPTLDKKAEK